MTLRAVVHRQPIRSMVPDETRIGRDAIVAELDRTHLRWRAAPQADGERRRRCGDGVCTEVAKRPENRTRKLGGGALRAYDIASEPIDVRRCARRQSSARV